MQGRFSHTLTFLEGFGFRKAKTEDDQQNRRARAKPVQRSPAVASGTHKGPGKDRCEKISEYISDLVYSREETTSRRRRILKCSGHSVAVHASHCNPEQAAASYELFVGVTETRCKLEQDEENLVYDVRPFAAIPIRNETENDGTDRTQHERCGDAPADVICGLVEIRSQRR